jgi:hypothetical protein
LSCPPLDWDPVMSDTSPKNQAALQHGGGARPPRQPKPGELLFEFVRVSDRKLFRCELRFHGESYGREAQWFDDGGHFASHGAFVSARPRSRGPNTSARPLSSHRSRLYPPAKLLVRGRSEKADDHLKSDGRAR